MAPEHQVVEQFVIAFPAFAAWVIVLLVGTIALICAYLGRQFLKRMDAQDETLIAIRDLLASEVGKLREMNHAIDKRVLWLEALAKGPKYGRRSDDETGGTA